MEPSRAPSEALPFRALELHGQHIWRREAILRALDFIRAHHLTALVLHETDLPQMVTYPRFCFDPHGLWRSAPVRRGENAIENNRAYLDHVLRLAANRGVGVFVEVKEIGFPDEILELHPELLKSGVVCPSEPFWPDFIERRTDELFADFPLLTGMISSAGSTEGKTSRAQNKCGCALCRAMELPEWDGAIIGALHRAASRHGKKLVVRDFAYRPEDHGPLLAAIARAPQEIVLSAKATPHDFYLTFVDNPALPACAPARGRWVEYDTMGQFNGWGVFPCLPLADLRARLARARQLGVEGILLRVEWERINDFWGLDTPNAVAAIAAAALANGEAIDEAEATRRWLAEGGRPTGAAAWLGAILGETEDVVRHGLYLDGFVFADNSKYPPSLARAFWGMEERDALVPWDPSRAGGLVMSRARVGEVIAEKERALGAIRALSARVSAGHPDLPGDLAAHLAEIFRLYETYIEGFRLLAEVAVRARWGDPAGRSDAGPAAADRAELRAAATALASFAERIRPLAEEARLPHQALMLLDHRRAAAVAGEALGLAAGREA